ncbi:MAG: 2-isopropylmalate synthase [Cyanobacteria bacterium SZAS LIN-2]|nr:2-isopropylmalate synthase [Cyanobacteria bacterium SZAS LIN-2]
MNIEAPRNNKHVKIFDTTLRDGQQCPGAGMSFEQNLQYARLACALRVDVLEAGFPSASKLDFDIVDAICRDIASFDYKPVIAGLCQLREEQVIRTIESLQALVPFQKARLHTYVPVDPELMPASLGSMANDKGRIVDDLYRLTVMAVEAGMEVQFSPEGYSRIGKNFDFVTELIRAAIAGGARVINCPDTIGGAAIWEGEDYFVKKMSKHAAIMKAEFPNHDITWSVHCHNDFGLAVQNSVNAVMDGPATQIEGCINGIGERAGNAALEQCIMIIKHFSQTADKNEPYFTTVCTDKLQEVSDFVSTHMLPRQPHWPVSGDNAAKHSSGGHTNAILKNPMAYQPFDPKEIGKKISFLFGPLSGGNHAKSIIEASGFVCADSEKAEIAQYVKNQYPQRRKGITDSELMESYMQFRAPINIELIEYSKQSGKATVKLTGTIFGDNDTVEEEMPGKDSALAAVKRALEKRFGTIQILSHRSQSDSIGIDACSVSEIQIIDDQGNQYMGKSVDHDIEISAIKALIDAVNRSYVVRNFSLPQGGRSDAPIIERQSQSIKPHLSVA